MFDVFVIDGVEHPIRYGINPLIAGLLFLVGFFALRALTQVFIRLGIGIFLFTVSSNFASDSLSLIQGYFTGLPVEVLHFLALARFDQFVMLGFALLTIRVLFPRIQISGN